MTSTETTKTPNPNARLTKRIQNALAGGAAALAKGQADTASDYLTTAEGLFEDLAPGMWQDMAAPALDDLAEKIDAHLVATHAARKGEGAFSYADA